MTNIELILAIKAVIERRIKELDEQIVDIYDSKAVLRKDELQRLLSFLDTLESEKPHYTKRNALFDKCVENCDPEVMKEVSNKVDEMIMEKPVPNNREEAADKHICKVVDAAGHPGWEWETRDIKDAFIAGAEWKYQKDRAEFAKLKAKEWSDGYDEGIAKGKEQMLKGAVEGEVQMKYNGGLCAKTIRPINEDMFRLGDKVRIIILKEDGE